MSIQKPNNQITNACYMVLFVPAPQFLFCYSKRLRKILNYVFYHGINTRIMFRGMFNQFVIYNPPVFRQFKLFFMRLPSVLFERCGFQLVNQFIFRFQYPNKGHFLRFTLLK